MLRNCKDKESLAYVRRNLNSAAKMGDLAVRTTFVLLHMTSEHREIAESAIKSGDEKNLFDFMTYCLHRFAEELERPSSEDYTNPIDLYKKGKKSLLQDIARSNTPAKNAVEKGLDESLEWPSDVPYEKWEEDLLQTAYTTLFGLYFFNTPAKDMMRWLGKDEPKNPRFVNAMSRHETAVNIMTECAKQLDADALHSLKKKRKPIYLTDEDSAEAEEQGRKLRQMFHDMIEEKFEGNMQRFCRENEDTAFEIFQMGLFSMLMPGKNYDRKGIINSPDHSMMMYKAAKKTVLGDKVTKKIVTPEDDEAAALVFYVGMLSGEQGVSKGNLPTDMLSWDVRRKHK